MARGASAATVGWVEGSATVFDLDDVIGVEAEEIAWVAAVLALVAGASYHEGAPAAIFRRQVERVDCLGWWLGDAGVERADQRLQHLHHVSQRFRSVRGSLGLQSKRDDETKLVMRLIGYEAGV